MSSGKSIKAKQGSIVSQVSRQFVRVYTFIFISAFVIFIGFQLSAVNTDLQSVAKKSLANYGFVKFQGLDSKQLSSLEIASLIKNNTFIGVQLELDGIKPRSYFKKGYNIADMDLVKYAIKVPGKSQVVFYASVLDLVKSNYNVFGFWFAVSILNTFLSYILLTRQVRSVIVEPIANMLSRLTLGDGDINLLPKLRTTEDPMSVNELDRFIIQYNDLADDFNGILGQQANKNSELGKQYAFYGQILDHISDSIVIIDEQYYVKYANLAFCQFMQSSIANVVGSRIDVLLPELSAKDSLFSTIVDSRTNKVLSNVELKVPVTREIKFFDLALKPMGVGYLCMLKNVTTSKITQKTESLKDKMTYIHDFAMGIVSQLHKPIASMLSSVENIRLRFSKEHAANQGVAADCATELTKINNYYNRQSIPIFLRAIDEMGKRLLNYTNDILSIDMDAKSNFDKFNLNNSIVEVIDQISSELQARASKTRRNDNQKFRITKFLDANLPAMILDKRDLHKILYLSLDFIGSSLVSGDYNQDLEIEVITEFDREHRQHIIYIQDNGGSVDYDPNNVFMPYGKFSLRNQPIGITMCLLYYLIINKYSGDICFDQTYSNGLKLKIAFPAGSTTKIVSEDIESVAVVS